MKITLTNGGAADADPEHDTLVAREVWVRCASCGARIAPESARIDVDGAHEHDFMNPSGIRFRIAFFALAPGCMPEGERSTVWTWVPGCAWQIALCKACGTHLGWSFHREGIAPFHGLVRDRIV